jgi:hypothetical protein
MSSTYFSFIISLPIDIPICDISFTCFFIRDFVWLTFQYIGLIVNVVFGALFISTYSWLVWLTIGFETIWSTYLHGLHLFTLANMRLGSNLFKITSNTTLLTNTYCIMYGPYHFFLTLPTYVIFLFWKPYNIITKLKVLLRMELLYHKYLFHCPYYQ